MALNVKIEIQLGWTQKQTELEECNCCGETIYSAVWQMWWRTKEKYQLIENTKVCGACKEALT